MLKCDKILTDMNCVASYCNLDSAMRTMYLSNFVITLQVQAAHVALFLLCITC